MSLQAVSTHNVFLEAFAKEFYLVLKTKQELIHKAKLKKSYSRLRARELASHTSSIPNNESPRDAHEEEDDVNSSETDPESHTGPDMHPDRQRALDDGGVSQKLKQPRPKRAQHDDAEAEAEVESGSDADAGPSPKSEQGQHQQIEDGSSQSQSRPRPMIFARAARGIAEKEARLEAARERVRQRREALEQRNRRRKAISKAQGSRGDRVGKQKLGRQSNVLLEKVRKLVGEA